MTRPHDDECPSTFGALIGLLCLALSVILRGGR